MSTHAPMAPSAPAIIRAGLGVARADDGPPAPAATRCGACRQPIAAGEAVHAWRPSADSFTDWWAVEARAVGTIGVCGDCAPLVSMPALGRAQSVVATTDSVCKLTGDAHRTWLLLDPPQPPFVAMIADGKRRHVAWKARVTLDADLIYVQVGAVALTIDRPLLLCAVGWCAEAARRAREHGRRVTPNHPFQRLDRNLDNPGHGRLRPDILAASSGDERLAALLQRLQQLGPGELWGLAVLAKANPVEPMREPIEHTSNNAPRTR
jgi:CRISPR type IV-associated protein Csf1